MGDSVKRTILIVDYANEISTLETCDKEKSNYDYRVYNHDSCLLSVWSNHDIMSGLTVYHNDELTDYEWLRQGAVEYVMGEFTVKTCSVTPTATTLYVETEKNSPQYFYNELEHLIADDIHHSCIDGDSLE